MTKTKTIHTRFKWLLTALLLSISVCLSISTSPTLNAQSAPPGNAVTFAMCRPEISQIKNIEHMWEKDIIPLKQIKLIAVYHEDENTDYTPARKYVEDNELTWVTFKTIKGTVQTGDLFKENAWTPQFKEIFDMTSGMIFTGGADLPPGIYNEEHNLFTDVQTPVRSFYETSFLFHLLGGSRNPGFTPFLETRKDYVVLGICLGCQTMNVACGGSLYQDIPSQVYGLSTVEKVLKQEQDKIHSGRYILSLFPLEKTLAPCFHRIKIKKNSLITKQMGMSDKDTPLILTSHHQALKDIGENLEVIATSMDGKIVEAIEHKKYPRVLGIQFHPEPFSLYMKGKYFKKNPGEPQDFNLRNYLETNPPSMEFHKKIWNWFSSMLNK